MNVKGIRAITGLSQNKFAEKYGINKRTLQNWERRANQPPQGFEKLLLRAVMEDQEKEALKEGQMKMYEQELYEPNPEPEQNWKDYDKLIEIFRKLGVENERRK